MESDEKIGCINFTGSRCSFEMFNRRSRPKIEARIKEEGGEKLELFNKLQKLLYDK
jgi:hypothetical protein